MRSDLLVLPPRRRIVRQNSEHVLADFVRDEVRSLQLRPRFTTKLERCEPFALHDQRVGADPEAIVAHVRERLRAEGPLMTKDFEDERPQGTDKAWVLRAMWQRLLFLRQVRQARRVDRR